MSEVAAALSGLMSCLHEDSESCLSQTLEYWNTWLTSEGYDAAELASWFLQISDITETEVNAEQLRAYYSASLDHSVSTGDYLETLNARAPGFLSAVQQQIDTLLETGARDRQLAGGKGVNIRPSYLGAGVIGVGIVYGLTKGGGAKKGYNYAKNKATELWDWATSTADEAESIARDDLMRDRLHPLDAIGQVETIAPGLREIGIDVHRLENATVPQVKAIATQWALRDMETLFPQSEFIFNLGWQDTFRDLIRDNPRIDITTYNELMNRYSGPNFDNTELAQRFDSITYSGKAFSLDLANLTRLGRSSETWGSVRDILTSQLQNSYESAIFGEIGNAVRDDVIAVEYTAEQFEEHMRHKAYETCAAVRQDAVNQFNRDLQVAKKASDKAAKAFIDIEATAVADFGESLDNIIER
jgi:hypothetical protein